MNDKMSPEEAEEIFAERMAQLLVDQVLMEEEARREKLKHS